VNECIYNRRVIFISAIGSMSERDASQAAAGDDAKSGGSAATNAAAAVRSQLAAQRDKLAAVRVERDALTASLHELGAAFQQDCVALMSALQQGTTLPPTASTTATTANAEDDADDAAKGEIGG
jgi:hypothetical protein